jgi:hypothetical protein
MNTKQTGHCAQVKKQKNMEKVMGGSNDSPTQIEMHNWDTISLTTVKFILH